MRECRLENLGNISESRVAVWHSRARFIGESNRSDLKDHDPALLSCATLAMKATTIFSALLAATLAAADLAQVYVQPVSQTEPDTTPSVLAEVQYHASNPSASEITNYEPPELPEDAELIRVGIYDPSTSTWSASSLASAENFAKGYAPAIMLSVDHKGRVLGASVKGVVIDAGQTRDFGPQVVVSVGGKGAQPALNKPVVLSPEGKRAEEEEEKSFLQK